MAVDAANVIVAANGRVAFAPLGTALPTDATTALNAAFVEVGYIDEDGVTITPDITTEDLMAWQSYSPIRVLTTGYILEISMNLMEWIEENIILALGGGVFTDNLDGTWDYQLPAPGEKDTYIMVIEGHDGNERYRWVLERVEQSETGDIVLNKGEASMFPLTVKALAGTGGRPGSIYADTNV